MKILSGLCVALAMSASAFSQSSAAAAPTLTAGADFKGLQLDWTSVSGASWYEVEYRAHQNSAFSQQGDDYPATSTSTRFSFPLHLYDWSNARYRVAACNSSGCTRSNEVSVSDLRRDAVGYFKASVPIWGGGLGASVDLTPDGYTLVAAAPGEPSAYSDSAKGRVYVFRRGSDRAWRQTARLDARTGPTNSAGVVLRVSASSNGNTVAVFMPNEIVGQPANRQGEVDVFRLSNGVYTPTRVTRGWFDMIYEADLDESGNFLVERGATYTDSGIVIYKWINGDWVNQATIRDDVDEGCWMPKLTPDAKALVTMCRTGPSEHPTDFIRVLSGTNWATRRDIILDDTDLSDPHAYHDHNAFAVDRTASTVAVQTRDENEFGEDHANVRVFHLSGAAYQEVAKVLPGAWNVEWDTGDFGASISLSGDGQTLAVGHPSDYGTSGGVRAPPLNAGSVPTGGVYVYRLTSAWKLVNVVKPNYVHSDAARRFGRVTAISGTGKTLVVGVQGESSGARGIGGNWNDNTRPGSGALFMY